MLANSYSIFWDEVLVVSAQKFLGQTAGQIISVMHYWKGRGATNPQMDWVGQNTAGCCRINGIIISLDRILEIFRLFFLSLLSLKLFLSEKLSFKNPILFLGLI